MVYSISVQTLISYSAYLWHQPIFAFIKEKLGEQSLLVMGAMTLGTFFLAYFSWKYIETPFRDKKRFNRKSIFLFSAVGMIFFISLGLVGSLNNGFKSYTPKQLEILNYSSYPYEDIYRKGICFLKIEQTFEAFQETCQSKNNDIALMIWGDSHAAALSYGLRQLLPNVIQYTTGQCPPIKDVTINSRPNCKDINDFVLSEIKRIKPAQIFIHANWSLYKEQDPINNLQNTIKFIKDISPKTEISIIGSVPQWKPSLPNYMIRFNKDLDGEYYLINSETHELEKINDGLSMVANEEGIRFQSVLDLVCKSDSCITTIKNGQKYDLIAWDYGHLTGPGSIFLASKILSSIGLKYETKNQ